MAQMNELEIHEGQDNMKAKPGSESQCDGSQSTQGTQLLFYSPQITGWADLVFLDPVPDGVRQRSWSFGPDRDKYSIGRGDMCDVFIPEPALSRIHCHIGVNIETKCIYLEDRSANGTLIEKGGYQTRVKDAENSTCVLQDGMKIILVQGSARVGRPPLSCLIHFGREYRDEVQSKFDVIRELGSGAFGLVRLGVEFESKRSFAIKTINKEKWRRVTAFSKSIQLTDEYVIMQQLDHPHICKLHDVIDGKLDLHLVLDYCAGGDMLEYLQKNGAYSESQSRRLFMQITSAVEYLHNQGIVHRDLKPENILLTNHTSEHIKLSDFGTSRSGNMTCCMSKVGTASYGAPEVALGPHPYNGRKADIWSMGVILYVMLSRKKITDDPADLWRLSQYNMIPFPMDPWAQRSRDVVGLICEMLAYHPDVRCTIERISRHPWICSESKRRRSKKSHRERTDSTAAPEQIPIVTDCRRSDATVSRRIRRSRKRAREEKDDCEDHVAKRQRSEPVGGYGAKKSVVNKSSTT